jgi:LmbE family N-acetylglucosaminyl deacetylase
LTSTNVVQSKILMVFAHADDETLLAGTLISKLVSEGQDVRILCLAPGNDDRTDRLRKACDDLGVTSVETLRYSEGTMWPDQMTGAASTDVSTSLDASQALALANVPIGDLANRISGRLVEINPDVVITHSPYGDYGHADHAAVYRAVVRAFGQSAGDDARLYALDWSRLLVRLNSRLMRLGGRDISRMGPKGQFNLATSIQASASSSISFDVANRLGARRIASRWYEPEISKGPLPMRLLERLPLLVQRLFLGKCRLIFVSGPENYSPHDGL